MNKHLARASERGMTLIEIMVVIVILGMIAAAVAVNVVEAPAGSRAEAGQDRRPEHRRARASTPTG